MDMFFNKSDSLKFNKEEINLVCDLIKSGFYGNLLENRGVLVGINCISFIKNIIWDGDRYVVADPVMHCKNRTTLEVDDIAFQATSCLYPEFLNGVEGYHNARAFQLKHEHTLDGVELCASILRVTDGDIISFGAIESSVMPTKNLHSFLYALTMSLYLIKESRYMVIDSRIVEYMLNVEDCFLSTAERKEMYNKILLVLNSDRESVIEWRNR